MFLTKIKLWIQKHSILLVSVLFGILTLFLFLFLKFFVPRIFGKTQKPIDKIILKSDQILNKAQDKVMDIDLKRQKIEIEKNVRLQQTEKERTDFLQKVQVISDISDKKQRLKRLIALNKSIKLK